MTSLSTLWRVESPKLIASVTRIVRDVGVAEELAQDALLAAMEQWPRDGVPDRPAAWLMSSARNRAIDHVRRDRMAREKHAMIGRDMDAQQRDVEDELAEAIDDEIGDDLLRLIFMTCHPALPAAQRVALALKVLGGLTTPEIARAFLVPEATMAQRIVRAKKTLAREKVEFEVPRGADRDERLATVLEVIYLIFNEGYSATAGDDLMRPALCEEGLRLGRVVAELAEDEPEVHGLVALMEITSSRASARVSPEGAPILLQDQDRARWNQLLIRRGLAALERAKRATGHRGPYLIQGEIASCHARAATAAETDWNRIASLYDELIALTPSPVVELNRAVAVMMSRGPAEALSIADALANEPALKGYHLLAATRAEILQRLGRRAEARDEFLRAAALTQNARERELLTLRADECY